MGQSFMFNNDALINSKQALRNFVQGFRIISRFLVKDLEINGHVMNHSRIFMQWI